MTQPVRLATLLCALACATLALQAPALGAAPPATASQIDAVVSKAFAADQPGAAVIVVKDGQVVYRKAVGMASLELGVPLQPDMVFRLGSITKQFTAAAVMLLVEQGKLGLKDPIDKYLPGYPMQGHVITVEHLLTHTSGIQSYTDIPGWMTSRITERHDGAGTRGRLQEGADAVRARRAVPLQQLRLRPARRHHREGRRARATRRSSPSRSSSPSA